MTSAIEIDLPPEPSRRFLEEDLPRYGWLGAYLVEVLLGPESNPRFTALGDPRFADEPPENFHWGGFNTQGGGARWVTRRVFDAVASVPGAVVLVSDSIFKGRKPGTPPEAQIGDFKRALREVVVEDLSSLEKDIRTSGSAVHGLTVVLLRRPAHDRILELEVVLAAVRAFDAESYIVISDGEAQRKQ